MSGPHRHVAPLRFAIATVASTWLLLVIGGIVNPMGASMACPDWYFIPTCNGELLPEMTGGVLYEHGHRLWASWVGLLTVALAVVVWVRRKGDTSARRAAVAAVVLVCFQGTLGGITVRLNLHSAVSTLHLGTAMAFFVVLIWLALRLATPVGTSAPRGTAPRRVVGIALWAVFAQIALGGLVRHMGAGLICGDDWLGCGPSDWTAQPLAHLHMTHRVVAYALVPLVFLACRQLAREARADGRRFVQAVAWWPLVLVVVQVGLGLMTVATGRSVPVVTAHTAIGALILGTLAAGYFGLGPEGARLEEHRRA